VAPSRPDPGPSVHATAVAFGSCGVLITGPTGSGKSDVAVRLITTGARYPGITAPASLVADDRVMLTRDAGGSLWAAAPPSLFGRLEVRGLGIMEVPATEASALRLCVDLLAPHESAERYPVVAETYDFDGVHIPKVRLQPFEASLEAKVLLALATTLGAPGVSSKT